MKTLKKLKNLQRKAKRTLKAVDTFICQTIKNFISMKKKIKSIWLFVLLFVMVSCGSTKVSVDKPAQGTSTTITVTTNNPITTEVNPNVELKNTK